MFLGGKMWILGSQTQGPTGNPVEGKGLMVLEAVRGSERGWEKKEESFSFALPTAEHHRLHAGGTLTLT
jgi:hypothetical protein